MAVAFRSYSILSVGFAVLVALLVSAVWVAGGIAGGPIGQRPPGQDDSFNSGGNLEELFDFDGLLTELVNRSYADSNPVFGPFLQPGGMIPLADGVPAHATVVRATIDGPKWKATLRFPAARLRVVGVLRKGRLDETVLSANDKDEIRQRMDEQVFGGTSTVVVRAEGAQPGRGSARVELGKGTQKVSLRHEVTEGDDGATRVEGRCSLSLRSLGVKEIKGPLGAFKVHDGIDVIYSFVLRPGADG